MVRFGATLALLSLAALLIPACGDGKGGGSPGGSSAGAPLFSEEFSGAFPGASWSAPFRSGTGSDVKVDAADGSPAPSLALSATDSPSFVGTTSAMSFASRPMTVSVRMAAEGSGEGSGGIAILDSAGTAVAAAEWHAATPSALTFRILGTTNPAPVAVPLPGSGFHTFTFSVTDGGEATWSFDSTPILSVPSFPSDTMRVQLYDNISSPAATTFATFRFDAVTVTSP